jgi:Uma2 family endonuclease
VVSGREPAGCVEQTPPLVVEVLSDAARERDMVFKRSLYQGRGVSWYVIADPDGRALRLLNLGQMGVYTESMISAVSRPMQLALCEPCRVEIDPATLFR